MILLLIGSFIAGVLTVLAPCVLPLLPVIIGGSVKGEKRDFQRPLVISISLAVSLFLFTLLLKATTVLIDLPPTAINYISGTIVILLGVFTLFPSLYAKILVKTGLEARATRLLGKGTKSKSKYVGPIITGAALGPVFSSCSPVYGYILATILPVNFGVALIYIAAYILGLSLVMLLIGYQGQRIVSRFGWMSNPSGAFQRGIAIVFIITGLLIFTGLDKSFQTFISKNTPFNFDQLSEQLIPDSEREFSEDKILNVEPYDAPEFTGLSNWINSEPIEMSDLRGKVVLVDFWTYSCINCIRNNPYLQDWHEKYEDDGLVVIGLHAPEFAFERKVENVQDAVERQGLTYPIALDNDFSTWGAYENQFWPTYYLIDADGKVRRIHSGEGDYRESEEAIRMLLTESGAFLGDDNFETDGGEIVPVREDQTPETYLGTKRASNFASKEPLSSDPKDGFSFPSNLETDFWALSGRWDVGSESIVSENDDSKLRFKIASKETYIVAGSDNPANIKVSLNGQPISETEFAGSDIKNSQVKIGEAKLYRLVNFDGFIDGYDLELTVPKGVELQVFTFGS